MTTTTAPARTTRALVTDTAGQWKLTGIDAQTGQCDCCSRQLTQRVFQVAHPDHGALSLGRRCAAKATGWAASAIEREQARIVRLAEVARRREIIAAERPVFAGHLADMLAWQALTDEQRRNASRRDWDAAYGHLSELFSTAATEDSWWGGRGWTAYATWVEYVDAHLSA